MHIIFTTSEKSFLESLDLPDDTSLVEKSETIKAQFGLWAIANRWFVKDGVWHLTWW